MATVFVFAILKHFVPQKSKPSRGDGEFYPICGKSGGEGVEVVTVFLKKMKNPGRWGVLSELPSVVRVWIFSGTTH